jgi:nickel-dependent lactate racemase
MRLGYGQGFVNLPDSGSVEIVLPEELPKAGSGEIEDALDHPLGKSLSDLRGRSASLLVSDITRPSPSHLLLPPLVKRLREIGVSDIKVVFGLGTHRRMAPEEEDLLLKDCVYLPHIQHDPKRCLQLGETKWGTPVEIFEEVASSDLIIATGNIEYHYYAGYSGGAKALLPGVSSERSVVKNHELMRDPRSISGRLDSPVRQDMEEAAKIAGLDFILNVVPNSRKEIVRAVAGDFIQAHRSGASVVDRMYRKLVNPCRDRGDMRRWQA